MTHAHPVELEDGLDFINTLEHSDDGDVEHLPTLEAAASWMAERGLLHADDVAREVERAARDSRHSSEMLDQVRSVRAGLRDTWDAVVAGRPATPDAVEAINGVIGAREIPRVEVAEHGIRLGHRHDRECLDEALGRLAEAVVGELDSDNVERLRVCANDSCRWVFRDTSPSGRRRWCSMASCGNRAKAARHRARARAPVQEDSENGG